MRGYYSDIYGTEFQCLVLACHITNNTVLILDVDENILGWCSENLIELEEEYIV